MTSLDLSLASLESNRALLSDKANHSPLEEFGRSLAYTAAQSPVTALMQPVDRLFGTKLVEKTHFIDAPEQVPFASNRYWLQQGGAAVGMIGTFWLAGRCVRGFTRNGLTEAELSRTLSNRGVLGLTLKEAAATGFLHDALLRPTDDKDMRPFLLSRVGNGFSGSLTMLALTAGTIGLKQSGVALEKTRPALSAVLKNELVGGGLTGMGAGFVAAQSHSLLRDGKFASLNDTLKSVTTMAVVGTGFGAWHRYSEGKAPAANRESVDQPARSVVLEGPLSRTADHRTGSIVTPPAEPLRLRTGTEPVADQSGLRPVTQPLTEHPGLRPVTESLAVAESVADQPGLRPVAEQRPASEPLRDVKPEAKPQLEPLRVPNEKPASLDPAADSIPYRERVPLNETTARIESVTETQTLLPKLKENADPRKYDNFTDFAAECIEHTVEPTVTYRFKGLSTEVVVQKEYNQQLNVVRDLRRKYNDDPTAIPDAELHAAGITREFAHRALPEDLVPLLEAQPDASKTHQVILSGKKNPEDTWVQVETPDHTSAATSNRGDQTMTLWQAPRDYFLRENIIHEFGHLLYYGCPRTIRLYDSAMATEPNLKETNPYANTNVRESWTVNLTENFLSPDAATAEAFFRASPVRSMVMAESLRATLEAAPQRTPLQEAYLRRIAQAELIARPLAVKALAEQVAATPGGGEPLALLLRYAQPAELAALKMPEKIDLSGQFVSDAEVAKLLEVSGIKEIDLSGTQVSDKVTKALAKAKGLEVVNLAGTRVTNTSIRDLTSLPLKDLNLSNTSLSDGGVSLTGRISTLSHLNISGLQVSAEVLASLAQRNPKLIITK